jgi:hypothetical protein
MANVIPSIYNVISAVMANNELASINIMYASVSVAGISVAAWLMQRPSAWPQLNIWPMLNNVLSKIMKVMANVNNENLES